MVCSLLFQEDTVPRVGLDDTALHWILVPQIRVLESPPFALSLGCQMGNSLGSLLKKSRIS